MPVAAPPARGEACKFCGHLDWHEAAYAETAGGRMLAIVCGGCPGGICLGDEHARRRRNAGRRRGGASEPRGRG
jgi:hypothetical protein